MRCEAAKPDRRTLQDGASALSQIRLDDRAHVAFCCWGLHHGSRQKGTVGEERAVLVE